MTQPLNIEKTITHIRALAAKADASAHDDFVSRQYEDTDQRLSEDTAEAVETAFLQLLTLSEALGLSQLTQEIKSKLQDARENQLSKFHNFEGEWAWSAWSRMLYQFADVIHAVYVNKETVQTPIATDLLTLLRNMQSAITDKRVYDPPKDEAEVHDRIESILKCVYPEVRRKPPLAKPITNFIPDTGIPSISTLIEYKYLSNASQIGTIANQILADTRGYSESEWNDIVFVIYETRRFKDEREWRQFLTKTGVPSNMRLVVLYGEPPLHEDSPPSKSKS